MSIYTIVMTSLHNIVAPRYIDYSAYVVDMVDNIASNYKNRFSPNTSTNEDNGHSQFIIWFLGDCTLHPQTMILAFHGCQSGRWIMLGISQAQAWCHLHCLATASTTDLASRSPPSSGSEMFWPLLWWTIQLVTPQALGRMWLYIVVLQISRIHFGELRKYGQLLLHYNLPFSLFCEPRVISFFLSQSFHFSSFSFTCLFSFSSLASISCIQSLLVSTQPHMGLHSNLR